MDSFYIKRGCNTKIKVTLVCKADGVGTVFFTVVCTGRKCKTGLCNFRRNYTYLSGQRV